MERIEVLSPCGNMESLYAAIAGGADAVYLGGILFSARAFANNFSNDEIIKAIKICHLYGVKVYITCNILVYEHEVERFMEYVDFLYQNNVDALIIQDIGMLDLIHKTYPNLELHASTQMHIHNLDGVLKAQKIGCKRVVLARETPIEKVKEIIEKSNVDIEIFAHGSLCVSYSGECLFSSLIGNRSGNRGSCVGSCRLPYKIVDETGNRLNNGDYPLSMKDLCTLDYLGELIKSNVRSLKIEGRMKSPEYVYTVTKLYKEAVDSYYLKGKVEINQELLKNLSRIFSRSYTKGYLFNESIYNIINSERPNHQGIYIGKVISYSHGYIDVLLTENVSIHDGLRIILDNEDYGLVLNEFYINKKIVKEAYKNDVIRIKVNKTIPVYSKVFLTKDDSLIKNIQKEIKENRRKVLVNISCYAHLNEKLKLCASFGKEKIEVFGNIVISSINKPTTKDDIKEKLNKINDTIYKINNLDIDMDENVFIPFKMFNELRHQLFNKVCDVRMYQYEYIKKKYEIELKDYPKEELKSLLVNNKKDIKDNYDIIYSENDDYIRKLSKVMDNYQDLDKNKEYLVGELGALNTLNNVITDYSFNVTNSYSVALLHSLGVKRVTLSLELNEKQIENIVNEYEKRYHKHPNLEVVRSSFREMMTLKTNLNKIYGKNIFLVDRFNNKYPIRERNNLSIIYENKKYISNIDYYRIGINVIRDEV